MSDKTENKAQNPFAKLAETQMAQVTAMWGEIEKLQSASLEHTKTALDETARLSKETLGYWANLGAESRRMTTEAVMRSMDLFSAAGR